MKPMMRQRLAMAGLGTLAGFGLYLLAKVIGEGLVAERAALALAAFALTFFGSALAMAGPVRMWRALWGAAVLGAVMAALLTLAGLRYDRVADLAATPLPLTAALILGFLPLPFFMAGSGPGWRDYPALFGHAWGLFVRQSLALVFVGVVWGVIFLSNALFGLVGLTVIDEVLGLAPTPWLVTGLVFGLAMAVVNELSDYVSPFLILRLLRLLLPPVLLVLAVFILALPLRGLSGLFGGLSSAATLLAMAAAGVTLVAAAVDQTDAAAVQGALMQRATKALALLLPVPAGLAAWALGLRVLQYGWTPDRLFGAWLSLLGLAYGLAYAGAVLRHAGWPARIRRLNVTLALATIASAALWLTPLANPEAIATRSQMARFAASGQNPEVIDIEALQGWGRAGAAARASLQALAAEPGQAALAARLAGQPPEGPPADPAALRAALVADMPLQPSSATATRDAVLAAADAGDLAYWAERCAARAENGAPGCVMLVADLWPDWPGEEALMVLQEAGGYTRYTGLALDGATLQQRQILERSGNLPDFAAGAALIATLQKAPPKLAPAPLNMIDLGETGLIMAP